MAQSFCQPLLEALGTAFGDHFRHHHGATGTHPPPSQRVAVAETGKQAESLNTGATLPIQLAEYFRPSNGLRRPFSLRNRCSLHQEDEYVSIPNGLRRPFSRSHA
jgi:hypothetical protein